MSMTSLFGHFLLEITVAKKLVLPLHRGSVSQISDHAHL